MAKITENSFMNFTMVGTLLGGVVFCTMFYMDAQASFRRQTKFEKIQIRMIRDMDAIKNKLGIPQSEQPIEELIGE